MKKSCFLIAAVLTLIFPFPISGAQESRSLIVRATLDCRTGRVRCSEGVLGQRTFQSLSAALAALVAEGSITTDEAPKVKDSLEHICSIQRVSGPHKGGRENWPD